MSSLGYRTLLPSNLVLGGYVGYDLRRTLYEKTFGQIGLGIEASGEKWEGRINGYIPVGETRHQPFNEVIDSGTIISNLRFSENQLLFSRFRQVTTNKLFEEALTGLDIEGGYKLLDWENGNLFGHLGTYYYDGAGVSPFLGVRGRLTAQINSDLRAGITVESDEVFGTNFIFQFGLSFGVGEKEKEPTPEQSVLARLGNPVQRRETIAIDRQVEQEIQIDQNDSEVALNPETGQPWRFLHVTGGATGGDGSKFETPFGQISEAVAIAQTQGNDIVYVDAGTNLGQNGFIIPNNVQVLSTAFERFLDVQFTSDLGGTETFNTQLPGSGTGILPIINGTTITSDNLNAMVFMGNNSVLSGFDLQLPATNNVNGVVASNVSGFNIDRNKINTTGNNAYGILAYAANGTVSNALVSGNSSSSVNSASGINIEADDGSTLTNTSISGNTVTTRGNEAYGILVYLANGTLNNTLISGNTINTFGESSGGIRFNSETGGSMSNNNLSSNKITTTGEESEGIQFEADNGGSITVSVVFGNTISTSGEGAEGMRFESDDGSTLSDTTIANNSITTSGENSSGINIESSDGSTISNTSITGNTISTSGNYSEGIYFYAYYGNISNTSITGNTISTSADYAAGIYFYAYYYGSISNTSITGNTISTSGNDSEGIYFYAYNGSISNTSITGNTISTSGNDSEGIFLYAYDATINNTTITDNRIEQAGSDSVLLTTNGGSNICIAEFTGNFSLNPGILGLGTDDLFVSIVAGTIDFVGFADVMVNNTGFDNIGGDMPTDPGSCP